MPVIDYDLEFIGRIVHYASHGTPLREDGTQAYPSVCRAAIVTAVDTYQEDGPADQRIGHVSLCVLSPEGMFFTRAVMQSEGEHRGGTWHWPERTEA